MLIHAWLLIRSADPASPFWETEERATGPETHTQVFHFRVCASVVKELDQKVQQKAAQEYGEWNAWYEVPCGIALWMLSAPFHLRTQFLATHSKFEHYLCVWHGKMNEQEAKGGCQGRFLFSWQIVFCLLPWAFFRAGIQGMLLIVASVCALQLALFVFGMMINMFIPEGSNVVESVW